MWNLEGQTVKALYLSTIPVEGVVTNSRVKYGGSVQHTIDLFFPITLHGDERTSVLVDADEVVCVETESITACEFD